MKNIFRILSVALVAGSMLFVACGKEEEPVTPTPSDPTTPTNPTDPTTPTDTTTTPTDPTAPIVVNFDGTTTEYEVFAAGMNQYDEFFAVLAKDINVYQQGYFINTWGLNTVGTHEYDADLMNPWIEMYTGDTSDAQYVSAVRDARQVVTAIDMNNLTISAVYTATLVDYPYYDETGEVISKNITITLTDAEWIDLSGAKKAVNSKKTVIKSVR